MTYIKLMGFIGCPGGCLKGVISSSWCCGTAAIGAYGGGGFTGKTCGGCWSALATFALTMSGSKGRSFAFGGMAFK